MPNVCIGELDLYQKKIDLLTAATPISLQIYFLNRLNSSFSEYLPPIEQQ